MGLNDQAMGAVFSGFALGYSLAQAPAGWLADRFGPRWLLAGAVALSQRLDSAHRSRIIPHSFWVSDSHCVVETAAFPGSARVIYDALPSSQHGRAHGLIFAASRIGAAGAFPVMAWLLTGGWRFAFFALAIPGLIWAALWAMLFRDERSAHAERGQSHTAKGPGFNKIWVLVMIQYFGVNFITFLTLSWMNPYLKRRYSLTDIEAAGWTVVPLLVGALAQTAAGTITDRLYKTRYKAWCRALPVDESVFGYLQIGLMTLSGAATVQAAVAAFGVAAFGAEMTISPSWAFCLDYGQQRSGVMTGTMNMAGNIGSFVSANAFPALAGANGVATAYFGLVSRAQYHRDPLLVFDDKSNSAQFVD